MDGGNEFALSMDGPLIFMSRIHQARIIREKSSPMEDFLWLANELPELKIILAHAGALYALDHPLPSNIYLDLAMPLLYPQEIYQQLIERIGAEKILAPTIP